MAEKELTRITLSYSEHKQKKWIITVLGFIVFSASAFFVSQVLYEFSKVTNNRTALTKFLQEKFPRMKI